MKFVLLCGGKGARMEGFDLPKPLCTLRGKSILYHVIDALPQEVKTVKIIYNEALEKVEFKRVVTHSCSELKQLEFVKINVETRGPVETVFVGMQGAPLHEPVLFIDNDTVNTFALSDIREAHLGIGTYKTDDTTKPYSFIKVSDAGAITDIREKEGISTLYSTGLYYFPSMSLFYELCHELFAKFPQKQEYFMSDLYSVALNHGRPVFPFMCRDTIPLGTHTDVAQNIERVKFRPMRICFDIDNTLITYSNTIETKEGIEPIPEMVGLVKKLHAEGNIIVLQTARGMKSCKSNLGKVGKSMAAVLSKLDEFEIPYDEIYFGKPWADLYVDDRAWNQYTNPLFSHFMFNHNLSKMHLPKNCSNNENTLYKNNRTLIKKGPTSSLEGEVYFYKKITGTTIESMFPRYQSSNHSLDKSTLEMEFIEGNTVSKLFLNKLLTKPMLQNICTALARMHETQIEDTPVSDVNIMVNYMGKLEERVKGHPNYSLPGIHEVVKTINDSIKCTKIVNVIHGDPWFDNMILTSNQEIKFLDMKGKIGSVLSIKGDTMVDYAKIYQSILGFDYLLIGGVYDPAYESLCRQWLGALLPFPIDDPVFEAVTACCILKTFFYFSKTEPILPIYKTLGKMRLFSFLL